MEENNTKEVNLLQLISLLFDWFKKVGTRFMNLIGSTLQLIFRQKIVFAILIVICIVFGQYMARESARVYKAEALALIYGGDAQTVKEVCRQLENSLATNNLISLGTKLSLPDSVASNITEINSYYIIDYLRDGVGDKIDFDNNHSLSDTLNLRMDDRLYIQVKTKNTNQIAKVETAILNFFNNNALLNSRLKSKREELTQQILICNTEMHRLDSLAKLTYFNVNNQQLQFDNAKLFIGKQEKQLFYGDLIQLQNIKSNAEKVISEIRQPVLFPSGLVVNPEPVNSRLKFGAISILVGFALAILISIFIENASKIIIFLNKKPS